MNRFFSDGTFSCMIRICRKSSTYREGEFYVCNENHEADYRYSGSNLSYSCPWRNYHIIQWVDAASDHAGASYPYTGARCSGSGTARWQHHRNCRIRSWMDTIRWLDASRSSSCRAASRDFLQTASALIITAYPNKKDCHSFGQSFY